MRQPAPVFLFGFERSGTTLLSMMVGAHPEIAVTLSVTGLWYRYGRRLDEYNRLRDSADVERLVDDVLGEERIRLWDVTLKREDVADGLGVGSFPEVMARFHLIYAREKGKARWGNVDIATLANMDAASAWFPEGRFVHIVRDGRDVALSHETYRYTPYNTWECASAWARALEVNLKMGAVLGPGRYLVVRYEDLVLDSETTLRRICQFVGVDYSSRMLEYPTMVDEKIPRDRRWLWPTLNEPPVKSNAYRWKTQMSRTKRIVFEREASGMLRGLGYETYRTVPKSLRPYGLETWQFVNRGGRLRRLAAAIRRGVRA